VLVVCCVTNAFQEEITPPRFVSDVSRHVIDATGLYQPWRVFSPPRTDALELEARVTFDDETTAMWHLPTNGDVIGSYIDYHWLKFVEHAALQDNGDEWPRLREPLARFIARTMTTPGHRAIEVTLITLRTWNLPIGDDAPSHKPTRVDEYFTLDLVPLGTPR
jgi:hypothetical protein